MKSLLLYEKCDSGGDISSHLDIYSIIHGPHKIINLKISLQQMYQISSPARGCLGSARPVILWALYGLQTGHSPPCSF